VRILVRAGELNCRNDWDKDLWQLREDGDRVLDVSMVKPDDERGTPGGGQRVVPLRSLGQDVVRPSQPLPPPDDILIGQDLDAPRLVSDDINREMLKRAREQYRARRLTTRPDDRPHGSATVRPRRSIARSPSSSRTRCNRF